MDSEKQKHFVLVHGACHGAWCWYKVIPLLKQVGHAVTALDLGASGINSKHIHELESFHDYVQPLMQLLASLPQHESVILVGHSFGGLSISMAMENFPHKILAAVFVNAYMPDCACPPGTMITEHFKWLRGSPMSDTVVEFSGEDSGNLPISLSIGHNDLEKLLYRYCPPEDMELAKMTLRPFKYFLQDLMSPELILTESKYGSIDRFYVASKGDDAFSEEFIAWNIEKSPHKATKFIDEAGHMPMFSKPKELALCLTAIADLY